MEEAAVGDKEIPRWKKRYDNDPNYRAATAQWRRNKMNNDPVYRDRTNMLKRASRLRCKARQAVIAAAQAKLTETPSAEPPSVCAR